MLDSHVALGVLHQGLPRWIPDEGRHVAQTVQKEFAARDRDVEASPVREEAELPLRIRAHGAEQNSVAFSPLEHSCSGRVMAAQAG